MSDWKSVLKADPTDWLLEKANPSVRYFALSQILDKPRSSSEVQEAKKEIMVDGVVPKILAKQNDGGYWEAPDKFYTAKYKGTVWQLIIIAELGADGLDARVKKACEDELGLLGRELNVPSIPFKKITHEEAVDLLLDEGFDVSHGEEIPWIAEEGLSKMFEDPFWIYDYPMTARGFYDREDAARPGILRDFDLLYPGGFGEAISGGEREYQVEKVRARIEANREDPAAYGWYLGMLGEGIHPSAGFGIGVERFTRYICGLENIWEAVPFPKVPGIASP